MQVKAGDTLIGIRSGNKYRVQAISSTEDKYTLQKVSPVVGIEWEESGDRVHRLYRLADNAIDTPITSMEIPPPPKLPTFDAVVPAHGYKDTNPKDAIASAKVPLALLSPIAKAHWASAMFAGMTKYGAWNWRVSGVRASVYLSAAQRHLDAYLSGEEVDPIDGTHHLGNLMACAAILLDAHAAGKLNDDRPPSVGIRDTYKQVEKVCAKLIETHKDKTPKHMTIKDTEK